MADERTPEQREADDNLLTAISERFRVYEVMGTDEVIDQFIVAAYINGLGLVERNSARYGYAVRDSGQGPDSTPAHALQGLVVRAGEWLAQPEPDDE